MRNLQIAVTSVTDAMDATPDNYKSVFTTCIVGNAVEEGKTGSFDEDSTFDRFDILDPQFPDFALHEMDSICHPAIVLMTLCGGFAEDIVRVIGDMEKSWLARCNKVRDADLASARALWSFARERACAYVELLYGSDCSNEFDVMGEEMFSI
ncbi:unnamed protein product [Ectocarpus sp. 6 AP-2014]